MHDYATLHYTHIESAVRPSVSRSQSRSFVAAACWATRGEGGREGGEGGYERDMSGNRSASGGTKLAAVKDDSNQIIFGLRLK